MRKVLILDKNTFGDSPACEYLALVLSSPANQTYIRPVGRFLSTLNSALHALSGINDDKIKRLLFRCVKESFQKNVVGLHAVSANPLVLNLVKNVMSTKLKRFWHESDFGTNLKHKKSTKLIDLV